MRGEIRSKQEPIYDAGSGPIPPDTSSVVSPELDVLSADLLSTDVLSAGDPSERAPGVSGGQLAQGVDQQLRAQLEQTQQNLLQMLSQVQGQMQQMGLGVSGTAVSPAGNLPAEPGAGAAEMAPLYAAAPLPAAPPQSYPLEYPTPSHVPGPHPQSPPPEPYPQFSGEQGVHHSSGRMITGSPQSSGGQGGSPPQFAAVQPHGCAIACVLPTRPMRPLS